MLLGTWRNCSVQGQELDEPSKLGFCGSISAFLTKQAQPGAERSSARRVKPHSSSTADTPAPQPCNPSSWHDCSNISSRSFTRHCDQGVIQCSCQGPWVLIPSDYSRFPCNSCISQMIWQKREREGWEQSPISGTGLGCSPIKLLPHLLRNHSFLSNDYKLPRANLTSLKWCDGEEINEEFLLACLLKDICSRVGVRCQEPAFMSPAPGRRQNAQPKGILTHTHTQTQLFCCCSFSDILSNPSQGGLMRIKKSAVSGATRLREHFLHTFT